ncbi:MAG: DNA repair protein RadC [Bacteroidales bacterium]|nr:DNA repair protein RadC [Bacteroidales bacterium]
MEAKKTFTVKDWDDGDKPREKLLSRGKKELSNAELLAILIRSGVPGKSAVDTAREILQLAGGSLTDLSRLEHSRLASIKGVGEAKAATILASLEMGWRMLGEIDASREVLVTDSRSLFNYMAPMLADLDHEEFWGVYLSNRHKVLGRQRIAVGGQTDTQVDMRILFRGALESKAVWLAALHNHPSGSLRPSKADIGLTKRIMEAGNILGIKLMEHLIIGIGPSGQASYFSFHDNNLLQESLVTTQKP